MSEVAVCKKAASEKAAPTRAGDSNESAPVRTCIGCRRKDVQSQLLRMVSVASAAGNLAAVVDVRHRLSGRGAWLHPAPDCLSLALKRRAIGRALAGVSDVSDVQAHVERLTGEGL